MQYRLTTEAAADLSRVLLPAGARKLFDDGEYDFVMADFGHPVHGVPQLSGTNQGFTGMMSVSWGGGFIEGVRHADARCVRWARWDLRDGARADLERVVDAFGAADHFILAVTGEVPPLLARALECVGAELVPDARPAPAGLLAAIQRSGRLHIPLGGAAALRWIVRLIGGAPQDASAIVGAMEEGRLDDARDAAHKAAGEDFTSYVLVEDDRMSIRWDGQWTSGRWASAIVWRDTPGCADLDAIIAWDEGDRDDDPRRGAGWSRHLDLPRAFGHLLAAATDLT